MRKQKKGVRIAAAAILATLSVIGISEASALPGNASAGPHIWCC